VLRGETKDQSYRRCWAEWQKVDERLLALGAPPIYKVVARTSVEYDPPKPMSQDDVRHSMEQLELACQRNNEFRESLCRGGFQVSDYRPTGVLMETLPSLETETENPEQFVKGLAVQHTDANLAVTVATELDSQFQAKEALARARQRAVKTASRFKQKIDHFVRWVGAALPVGSISDSTLLDYHGQLCKEIADGKRTAGGAQDQLRAVTHFIRTAFCPRGTLESLPRVLQVARSPLVFEDVEERESRRDTANWFDDLDTLKRIIKASPDRLRLWLYLMLNCAFQQTDVSELAKDEIDWKNQQIKDYKRRKGRRKKNVPRVTYPLWPETFRLLASNKADLDVPNRDGIPRALLNENGARLLDARTDTDNISKSYERVVKDKLKLKGRKKKPLAALRKTSSTLLQHSVSRSSHAKDFTSVVSFFLGQSPSNVAKLHYTPEDQTLLTEAVAWLGAQYRKAGVLF
jgi:hypothetical protein